MQRGPQRGQQRLLQRANLYPADNMSGQGARLELAIKRRGFASVADFAREVGLSDSTVRAHIHRDSIPKDTAPVYARKLRVSVDWLLYERGPGPEAASSPPPPPAERANHVSVSPGHVPSGDEIAAAELVRDIMVKRTDGRVARDPESLSMALEIVRALRPKH